MDGVARVESIESGVDVPASQANGTAAGSIEEALSRQRELLEAIIDNIPVMLCIWDPHLKAFRFNRHLREVLGWTEDDTTDGMFMSRVYPDPEYRQMVIDYMQSLEPGWRDLKTTAKDGAAIDCSWANVRLSDDTLVGIGIDIRARKSAEDALAQARAEAEWRAAELQSFISSMAEGVTLFDADGNAVCMNDAGRAILGVPPGERFDEWSKYQRYALDGEPIDVRDAAPFRALRGEMVRDMRYRIASPWGRETVISVSSAPVCDGQGRVIGATNVFRDITEQAEFEWEKDELLQRERRISEVLQNAIIPPEVPEVLHGYRLAVRYQPAMQEAEVGGDFYDVFDLNDGKVGMLIGDVTGKGLAAAIRVAAVRHAVRSYAYLDPRPARVMALANDALCKDGGDEAGILTAFFAVFGSELGGMSYSSAGHEPPVVCSARGHCEELEPGGLPLGLMPGASYPQANRRIGAGDTVLMITDGITEARAAGALVFGKGKVIDLLRRNRKASLDDIASRLLEAAAAHAGGRLQDDAAIVVVRAA